MFHYEKKANIPEYYWNEPDDCGRQERFDKAKKKYGFDPRELWSLDYAFIAWIYPRLKLFTKTAKGQYPDCFKSCKDWQLILKEMIDGFEYYLKTDGIYDDEACKRLENSMDLFRKYYRNLWY